MDNGYDHIPVNGDIQGKGDVVKKYNGKWAVVKYRHMVDIPGKKEVHIIPTYEELTLEGTLYYRPKKNPGACYVKNRIGVKGPRKFFQVHELLELIVRNGQSPNE